MQVGKKLLTGNINLISISMPVKMFEPRSYLQKLTDVWVYPRFLAEAAEATDPLVRLQLVMTWYEYIYLTSSFPSGQCNSSLD